MANGTLQFIAVYCSSIAAVYCNIARLVKMSQLAHFLTIGSYFDNPVQNCLEHLTKF